MKICAKCGAVNSDNKFFCVDCSEKLGDAVSELEQNKIEREIDSNIDNLYNDNDPLHVTLFDKIIGIMSIFGLVLCFSLLFANVFIKADLKYLWISVFLFILSAIEALFPKFLWHLEKLRLSFTISNSDDAEPSTFYRFCRITAILFESAIGIIILIGAVYEVIKLI